MKRKLFFWLEELRITRQERIAVTTLLLLLGLLTLLNGLVEPPQAYGESDYAAIEEEFRKRSAALVEQEAQILARYHPVASFSSPSPSPSPEPVSAAGDTVPAAGDSLAADGAQETNRSGMEKIDINTADIDQLQVLSGIGPSYARRIVDYRTANGPFKSIEELKNIKGIGEKRLEKLRPYIRI